MPPLITDVPAGMPLLPANFADSQPQLRYQGAEALIYKTTFPITADAHTSGIPANPAFLKFRPKKPYRHPAIDAKLTRHRILAEARVLAKLRREGVAVPAVYALDWEQGWMLGEWIDAQSVRAVLDWAVPAWLNATEHEPSRASPSADPAEKLYGALTGLMSKIGLLVGKMHAVGVVHGDLTTSNLLLHIPEKELRSTEPQSIEDDSLWQLQGDVFLIDFGLVDRSIQDEDRAVDLYVLERAFGSTHPQTEELFRGLLRAYSKSYNGAHIALKRLEDVRMRGRKKIMIG